MLNQPAKLSWLFCSEINFESVVDYCVLRQSHAGLKFSIDVIELS